MNERRTKRVCTIETADNRFLVVSLPDHDLDVRICACERLKLGEEESACVIGRGPLVTVLKDEFSYLGDKGNVAVGGMGAQRSAEEGQGGRH